VEIIILAGIAMATAITTIAVRAHGATIIILIELILALEKMAEGLEETMEDLASVIIIPNGEITTTTMATIIMGVPGVIDQQALEILTMGALGEITTTIIIIVLGVEETIITRVLITLTQMAVIIIIKIDLDLLIITLILALHLALTTIIQVDLIGNRLILEEILEEALTLILVGTTMEEVITSILKTLTSQSRCLEAQPMEVLICLEQQVLVIIHLAMAIITIQVVLNSVRLIAQVGILVVWGMEETINSSSKTKFMS
jgi:hypothetical protein